MDTTLNIHPVFVHFPIALLTIYALTEFIRFKKILEKPYWFYSKAILAILGAISGYLALGTGSLIEDEFQGRGLGKLVEMHSTWAEASIFIFSVLAGAYIIAWVEKEQWIVSQNIFWRLLVRISSLVLNTPLSWILALAGLVAITVTGALGGAIAFGPTIDPLVSVVYRTLIK